MDQKYTVHWEDDMNILELIQNIPTKDITIYTDGSLIKDEGNFNRTGAGISH